MRIQVVLNLAALTALLFCLLMKITSENCVEGEPLGLGGVLVELGAGDGDMGRSVPLQGSSQGRR